MSDTLVSIITISRNSAQHIEQAIRSVVGQDYPNIEYIVVDGGSTDGTLEIIERHAEGISRWVSEPDQGPGDAIRKGMRMATGEVIAFLNSDDYYADTSVVRSVVEVFEGSVEVKMIYGKVNFIDALSGESIMLWGRDREPSYIRKKMYIPTPSVFSRREVWDEVGPYREDYKFADDYEWALRALKITRPYFLDRVVACMRNNGRSGRNYRKGLSEMAKALREHGYYADYLRLSCRNIIKVLITELGLRRFIYKVQMSISSKGL